MNFLLLVFVLSTPVTFLKEFLNLGRLLKSFYMSEKLFENPILVPGFRPGTFEFKVVSLANTPS